MDKFIYCTETIKNDLVKKGYSAIYEENIDDTKYYIFDYVNTNYLINKDFFITNKIQL